MLDLYFWTTPNGYKPLMLIEELGLECNLVPINIGTGAQFDPEFLKIAPNNRIPALVDPKPKGGGDPVSVFESGAILMYLAEKHGAFLPNSGQARAEVLQWLMWQMGGLGPMAGQAHHFLLYAPEDVPYGKTRYANECNRLYGVLNKRLADREFVAGDDYSIADMASYPWAIAWERQGQKPDDFPNVQRWMEAIRHRAATVRAYERGKNLNVGSTVNEKSASILFGQTAASLNQSKDA